MIQQPERLDRWALLFLQVLVGVLYMMHGFQKLFGMFGGGGISGTAAFFQKFAITPALFWAWVVAIVEFFGGLSILLGFLTRIWASLIIIEMIVAIIKVNWARGFYFDKGGWEIPLAFGGLVVALALMGPGFLSVDRALGLEKRID